MKHTTSRPDHSPGGAVLRIRRLPITILAVFLLVPVSAIARQDPSTLSSEVYLSYERIERAVNFDIYNGNLRANLIPDPAINGQLTGIRLDENSNFPILDIHVLREGPFSIRRLGGRMFASQNVRIKAEVNDVQMLNVAFPLQFSLDPSIGTDWKLNPGIRLPVPQHPALTFRFPPFGVIDINLFLRELLTTPIGVASIKINNEVKRSVDMTSEAQRVWDRMHFSEAVMNNPTLYLTCQPLEIGVEVDRYTSRAMVARVGTSVHLSLSDARENPTPGDVPLNNLEPRSGGINLIVPVSLSESVIQREINKRLSNVVKLVKQRSAASRRPVKPVSGQVSPAVNQAIALGNLAVGNFEASVPELSGFDVQLHPGHIKGSAAFSHTVQVGSGSTAVTGRIALKFAVSIEDDILIVKAYDPEIRTSGKVRGIDLNTLTTALVERAEGAMQLSVSLPFEREKEQAINMINSRIDDFALGEGISLQGSISSVGVGPVSIEEDLLRVSVKADGESVIVID